MFYLDVIIFGVITALFTGIGALPLFTYSLIKKHQSIVLAIGQILAAGFMTLASLSLIHEGADEFLRMLIGLGMGIIFIIILNQLTKKFPEMEHLIQADNIKGAKQGILIIALMTIHSMAEGVGIGVSFGGGHGRDLGRRVGDRAAGRAGQWVRRPGAGRQHGFSARRRRAAGRRRRIPC